LKKFRILACSLLAVLVLTGCGSKTLTCTKSETSSGLDMTQEIKIVFKGDKVKDLNAKFGIVAVEQTIKNSWDTLVPLWAVEFPETNEDGIKVSVKNDKNNYSFQAIIEIDADKVSESSLETYDLDGLTETGVGFEQAKENFEGMGYTCK